jgi:riboflavin kinase/FMN adenylyltransferase
MRKGIVITGIVVRGAGYGQKLGFPTANLDRRSFGHLKRKPKLGIYAGLARILPQTVSLLPRGCPPRRTGVVHPAAIVIGPKDDKGHPKIEAHLIGFRGVLYGRRLRLSFIKYLRPFRVFKSEKALKKQVKKDLCAVRKLSPLPRGASPTFPRKWGVWVVGIPTQKIANRKWRQRQAPQEQQRFFS